MSGRDETGRKIMEESAMEKALWETFWWMTEGHVEWFLELEETEQAETFARWEEEDAEMESLILMTFSEA
jgi:hypothetical protein